MRSFRELFGAVAKKIETGCNLRALDSFFFVSCHGKETENGKNAEEDEGQLLRTRKREREGERVLVSD